MISSVSAERFGGTSMPSALAVLRLVPRSYFRRRLHRRDRAGLRTLRHCQSYVAAPLAAEPRRQSQPRTRSVRRRRRTTALEMARGECGPGRRRVDPEQAMKARPMRFPVAIRPLLFAERAQGRHDAQDLARIAHVPRPRSPPAPSDGASGRDRAEAPMPARKSRIPENGPLVFTPGAISLSSSTHFCADAAAPKSINDPVALPPAAPGYERSRRRRIGDRVPTQIGIDGSASLQ